MASSSTCSVFYTAVERVITNWTAIKMAVEHGMGGSQSLEKVRWLIDEIDKFYKDNAKLYPDEVEYFIGETLNINFDILIEDGSLREVSDKLCRLFSMYENGNISELQQAISTMPESKMNEWTITPDEEEMEQEDSNQNNLTHEMENVRLTNQDEDGWTTVVRRR